MRWFLLALGAAIALTGVASNNKLFLVVGVAICAVAVGADAFLDWLRGLL